jgi:hypothetical protein
MKKIIYLFLTVSLIFSSCKKEEGCKDAQATNYNADAEEDDGSCLYNITGIWSVDDYILNGVSLFSSAAGNSLTSMAVSLYADGTSWSLAYYSDGTELSVYGIWSLPTTSTLSMTNSAGQTTLGTITKLNGSQCEISYSDVGGLGPATLKLSR